MRNWGTYRQGRSYHTGDHEPGKGNHACKSFVLGLFGLVGLGALLFYTGTAEYNLASSKTVFAEIGGSVTSMRSLDDLNEAGTGALGHVAGPVQASVADPSFGLRLDGGLKLRRETQYCQWREIASEHCQTCRGTDSEGKQYSYSCNCVTTYHYLKGWQSHLIPSLLFNQPATHHNPMRNPFPRESSVARDAAVASGSLTMALSPELLNNAKGGLRAGERLVDFAPRPGSTSSRRTENIQVLHDFVKSPAYTDHNFAFTNQEGWFFSAHEESMAFRALRGFGQYLEGSLLDWQLGDLFDMVAGCTAGDIRVRFHVVDPESATAIGQVHMQVTGKAAASLGVSSANSLQFPVGFVHAGLEDIEGALNSELQHHVTAAWWARAAALLAGVAAWALAYGFRTASRPVPDDEQVPLFVSLLLTAPLGVLGLSWWFFNPGSAPWMVVEAAMVAVSALGLAKALFPSLAKAVASMGTAAAATANDKTSEQRTEKCMKRHLD